MKMWWSFIHPAFASKKRGGMFCESPCNKNVSAAWTESALDQIVDGMILVVDPGLFEVFEEQALARIAARDPADWPVVATALLLDAPIWTEDNDFFGSGIATWTSDRVELYLRDG